MYLVGHVTDIGLGIRDGEYDRIDDSDSRLKGSQKKNIWEGREECSCLACENIEEIDYCHIISQKDPEVCSSLKSIARTDRPLPSVNKANTYRQSSTAGFYVVNFDYLAHEDNGVILCASSHRDFDRAFPMIYLIPYDVQWFIK